MLSVPLIEAATMPREMQRSIENVIKTVLLLLEVVGVRTYAMRYCIAFMTVQGPASFFVRENRSPPKCNVCVCLCLTHA